MIINGWCGFLSKTKLKKKQLADNFAKVIEEVFPDETGYCAVRTGSFF